ncbi:MAG: flagellar biosynthetic protein FliO [Deltaproteobacteria bacterium]|nr:flagellar biosynthetic protein FliO [Deltaproteobacteria bacterium]MBW2673283.1 flagellar biosynthetic protein FliO [Deltaproteobacteria bacterium]
MNSPELFSSLLKIGSALAVTVGVLIVTAYLFKKATRRGGGEVDNRELIRILSSRYLGPKSSIMLVDVLGQVMVVGLSSGTISLLTEIMDPEALEHLKNIRGQKGKGASFSDYLKGYLKRPRIDS